MLHDDAKGPAPGSGRGSGSDHAHDDSRNTRLKAKIGLHRPSGKGSDSSMDVDDPNPRLDHYKRWVERQKTKAKAPKVRIKKAFQDAYQKWIIEGLLQQRPLPPSVDGRHIPLGAGLVRREPLIDERRGLGRNYISNFIRSSRYTIWSFLPSQLIFQFSKLANFYFLCIAILQLIPGLSTIGSYTTIAPLMVFVFIAIAKEGYDDYQRYDMDKSENRSPAYVLDPDGKVKEQSLLASQLWSNRAKKKTKHVSKKVVKKMEDGGESGMTEMQNMPPPPPENDGIWSVTEWQDLRVGDVVRLKRDDNIPADIILLHATGPNGVAYIETMALDGETNLKSKQACPSLAKRCSTVDGIAKCPATIVSEDPNHDLYNYDGRVILEDETTPLTMDNVVYRGSTLRNTTEATGIVINTGEECKIRMNANKHIHIKSPAMQFTLNKIVLFLVLVLILITVGCTGGYYLFRDEYEIYAWYLNGAEVPFEEVFFGFVIMFNTLIPLSLYVSLEIIKIFQFFLMDDIEMYDEETDTPVGINTTTILENLGQVSYIFSDKTGTLTENKMRFRKLSVAGTAWMHDEDIRKEMEQEQERLEKVESKGKGPQLNGNATPREKPVSTVKPEPNTRLLLEYIRDKPHSAVSKKAKQFLLAMALCHTCLPERRDDGELTFQASSPDELALVQAAQELGYLVIDRPAQTIKLQTRTAEGDTVIESYEVLDVIEFSSARKRMSIIIRMPDGRICIFCKGADNVIMPRLRQSRLAMQKQSEVERRASEQRSMEAGRVRALQRTSTNMSGGSPRNSLNLMRRTAAGRMSGDFSRLSLTATRKSTDLNRFNERFGDVLEDDETWGTPRHSMALNTPMTPQMNSDDYFPAPMVDESLAANDGAVFERCFKHLDDFATEGLRTLLFAHRYINQSDYATWKKGYLEATTSLVDRQKRIEEAAERIEKGFELTGGTAIEDRLQSGVPDTIDKLRRANIKVWMLTGDKRETAINIAYSARICKPFSDVHILDAKTDDLQQRITSILIDISRGMTPHSVLVIDGQTLLTVENDESLKIMFYDLVVRIDAVVCCRASPSQKANLVQCIRDTVPSSLTLAIGDGANDIAMIQAAHVGVGISGREGLQAARVADYSIAQFRFLQRLLFVHGRWVYHRTGKYILATFWKEIVFYMVQAQYQKLTGYSGTSIFESWSLTIFNVLFTSLPVILLGIFEIDLHAETLIAVPELYTYGQQGLAFNLRKYIGWMLVGCAETAIVFAITWRQYDKIVFDEDNTIFPMGNVAYLAVVVLINLKCLVLELHYKNIVTGIGAILSVIVWFPFEAVANGLYEPYDWPYYVLNGLTETWGPHLAWWVSVAAAIAAVCVFDTAVTALRRIYFPNDTDLWQEIESQGGVEGVLNEYTAELGLGGQPEVKDDLSMPDARVSTAHGDKVSHRSFS